ncbi:PadR family transcriptional regulator [Dactylosporangium sp. NPDC049525]|uniref:PadR family transcriptional regulator n=1 Tax=Dactylosporangium sp. NPDC049525 TaxID=3154730 RepID=UPI003439D308
MTDRNRTLTTTAYALLGLLDIRPWTTYELAKQVARSLRLIWPRAESNVYEGPKALVAHGLATARQEHVGRRPRTVYAITPAGREALRQWRAEPGAGPTMEFEALLKVLLGDASDKESLLTNIRAARDWADRGQQICADIGRGYVQDGGPLPERLPIISLTFPFLLEFAELVERWSERAEQEVRRWPDDPTPADADLSQFQRAAALKPAAGG